MPGAPGVDSYSVLVVGSQPLSHCPGPVGAHYFHLGAQAEVGLRLHVTETIDCFHKIKWWT